MSKTSKKPATRSHLASLVAQYQRARKSGRLGYERADRLIQEIAKAVKPGEEIALGGSGRKAILHDRFAEASQKGGAIWTPSAARRWELEIVEP